MTATYEERLWLFACGKRLRRFRGLLRAPRVTFCDASGLGVLARIARHARQAGRQLSLTSARPSLLKIMRITGLDRAFPELHPAAHAYSALIVVPGPRTDRAN